ncbi:type I secretion C-terminal target domain-containing protein, partial [Falsigemmobacter intermedius]
QDLAGNDAASFTDSPVINTVPDTTAPLLQSAETSLSESGVELNPISTTGSMQLSDGSGSGVASVAATGPAGLSSGGQLLVWDAGVFSGDTFTLTGSADGQVVAVLTVTTAGAYSLTLSQPLDHPVVGAADTLSVDFAVTATDASGNTSAPASLSIGLVDGLPQASAPALFAVTSPTTVPITGSMVDTFGADGAGRVSQISLDGIVFSYDGAGAPVVTGSSDLVPSSSFYSFDAPTDTLTVGTIRGETFAINMATGSYSYDATGVSLIAAETQQAPTVALGESNSLLDLVSLEALGLLDFSEQQAFQAVDPNNNITSVTISLTAIDISLGAAFQASSALATEFGLQVDNSNDLGILDFSASITISAIGGGPIDNQRLNEFLGTVYFSDALFIGLGSTFAISAQDSTGFSDTESRSDLLSLSLLSNNSPTYLTEGGIGADSLVGGAGEDRIYGYEGNDTISGLGGSDILRGGAGNDSLNGGDGLDILSGGIGNDTMSGGTGIDLFLWEKGDGATTGSPAVDTITDFDARPVPNGGDILDLSGLLIGEGKIGSTSLNLTNYLHFAYDPAGTGATVVSISTTGGFLGGFATGAVDQEIRLEGVNLVGDAASMTAVIEALLANGNLVVDEATQATSVLGGTTVVNGVIVDAEGDSAATSVTFDGSGMTLPPADPLVPNNVAPEVQVGSNALLSILGLDALGVVLLGQQHLTAADANGNLRSVTLRYSPLISVDLVPLELAGSQALAAELGLKLEVVNNPGLLGLVAPSSTLQITALNGGNIDNLAINELLATVQIANAATLLGLNVDLNAAVLDNLSITATDSSGATATDTIGRLLDANALNTLLGDSLPYQEGDSDSETMTGTAAADRLYSYAGDDTLQGNGGADILRAGDGDDLILIADDGFVLLDGGTGLDILQVAGGTAIDLTGPTRATSIETIDLGAGDAGSSLTLDEETVLALTDAPDLLRITGDSADSVTALGAVAGGVSGGFQLYTLGGATFEVEEAVTVFTT